MAYATIWITIASMIQLFDIKKALDNEGKPIVPSVEYFPGLARSVQTSSVRALLLIGNC